MNALDRQVLTDLDIFVDAAIRLGESAPTAKPILADFIRVLRPAAAAIVFQTLDAVIAHLDPPPAPEARERPDLVLDEAAFLKDVTPEAADTRSPIPPPVVEPDPEPPAVITPAPPLPPVAVPIPPPDPPKPLVVYTPDRIAVMQADYPNGISVHTLLANLNKMPGPQIKSVESLGVKLSQLGIKRAAKPAAPPPARNEPSPPSAGAKARQVEPVLADTETIIRWGASRGLNQHKLELDKVNDRRFDLGLAPFAVEPRHGKARTA